MFGHLFGRFDTWSDSQSGGPGFKFRSDNWLDRHFSAVGNSVPISCLIVRQQTTGCLLPFVI